MTLYLGIDWESRSRLDIRETGSTQYARDPSTSPLFLGWCSKADGLSGNANIWNPGETFPPDLKWAASDPQTVFVAHNTQFDRTMWRVHLTEKRGIPLPKRWLCTAVRCSANGLPRGLDEACHALGFDGKDKDGQKALRKLYSPDKKTGKFIMPGDSPAADDLYKAAKAYCRTDIQRMFQLFDATKPISEADQEYFEFDQRMNERGFALDADDLERLLEVLELAYNDIDARSLHLPPLNSVKQVLDFCNSHGCELPNLQAQTITEALKDPRPVVGLSVLPAPVREILELRQLAGLKAPTKLKAFKQRGMKDGDCYVIRDTYVMNGAHTGRHTSKGVQSQNLKRDCATELEMKVLKEGDLETCKLVFDEPLRILGTCIRPLIKSRKKHLLIGDFAKIEVCVLFWLAREMRGLKMLEEGKDLYCDLATSIYKRVITKKDNFERQLGKQGILGCGFGCGPDTFVETCAKYGIKISWETSADVVKTYREVYATVKNFWHEFGNTMDSVLPNPLFPGRSPVPQSFARLKIASGDNQLVIILPSGRKLRYQKPSLEFESGAEFTKRTVDGSQWQRKKTTKLKYWQGGETTHHWAEQWSWGGKLTENVVQAIANDLQREASLRLEAAGFDIVISSHDELVAEAPEERLDEFLRIMSLKDDRPKWAEGIPISVDGKATLRYRKG
jgi:DNA polymerase